MDTLGILADLVLVWLTDHINCKVFTINFGPSFLGILINQSDWIR